MKVAMWGLLLFILGIGAIVLINIFGNITTTNQQDYTLIKNVKKPSGAKPGMVIYTTNKTIYVNP